MPLFICSKCKCIDNTALAVGKDRLGYWGHSEDPLCTECLNGEWHDCFPKRKYKGDEERVINPPKD